MKRTSRILGVSLSLAALFGLASCSNEVTEPANGGNEVNGSLATLNLVKAPDFVVWSGSETIENTFGQTRGTVTNEDGTKTYLHNEEVEVNLALLDDNNAAKYTDGVADLVTKLSIHVRCATDVEIKIPVPANYLIESDDLYIFHEHWMNGHTDEGVYGGTLKTLLAENADQSLTLEEYGVTLTVSFDDDGITVKTTGIDSEVIEDCFKHNNDGLNFEVYNYYQTAQASWTDEDGNEVEHNIVTGVLSEEDREAITTAFGNSTISFTTAPKYYINAFGWEMDPEADVYGEDGERTEHGTDWNTGNKDENHFTVTPESGYTKVTGAWYDKNGVSDNGSHEQFNHLNGTPYNTIYVLAGEEPDHAHGGAPEPKVSGTEDDTTTDTEGTVGDDDNDDDDDDNGEGGDDQDDVDENPEDAGNGENP